ncbi:hypothetical protein KB235_05650 [Exiguobacterium alkaliphilum]|nr:hypothetical protein KB235_05650 [Exiguobacterium alkaliphilum]
MDRNKDGWACK